MNVKILGGQKYTGSAKGITSYMCHELREEGKEEVLKDKHGQEISQEEATKQLDSNKKKLCADQDKFFAVIISPSSEELKKCKDMDKLTHSTMDEYAKNFGLQSHKDLMYFYAVHEKREDKNKGEDRNKEDDKHIHVVVSRKCANNQRKISPLTNHRAEKGEGKGAVKNGFSRFDFVNNVEKRFDKEFNHVRRVEDSFEYQHARKNGNLRELDRLKAQERAQEKTQVKPFQRGLER